MSKEERKKLINLEEKRPRLFGEVLCLACKHEWEAVSPIGTEWLECPRCGLLRGRYIYPCERPGLVWSCNCENNLFYMIPDGIYCPNCGEWQRGF